MIGRSHEFTTGHCAFSDTWPITILLPSKSNNAEAVFLSVAVQLYGVFTIQQKLHFPISKKRFSAQNCG